MKKFWKTLKKSWENKKNRVELLVFELFSAQTLFWLKPGGSSIFSALAVSKYGSEQTKKLEPPKLWSYNFTIF